MSDLENQSANKSVAAEASLSDGTEQPPGQLGATDAAEAQRDRTFIVFNAVVSTGALIFLGWLIWVHQASAQPAVDVSFLPGLNACFNGAAATFLLAGLVAIRSGRRALHMRLMVSAFACSSLFLVGYVAYHSLHGDTHYEGAHRGFYLGMLASHVLLSMTIVPGALTVFYLAWRKRFALHRRIARVLLPVWVYVSVTGVLIYFMLHR